MLTGQEDRCAGKKAEQDYFSQGKHDPQILRLAIHNVRTATVLAVRTERAISYLKICWIVLAYKTSVRDQSAADYRLQ